MELLIPDASLFESQKLIDSFKVFCSGNMSGLDP